MLRIRTAPVGCLRAPSHAGNVLRATLTGIAVSFVATLRAQPALPVPVEGTCDYDVVRAAAPPRGWRAALEEDFDRGLSQWRAWSSGAFNQELQLYRPENATVADGVLMLLARREPASGATSPTDSTSRTFEFTSGRVESRAHYSASPRTREVRIQARIRLPRGYGLWPAFWTYGDPWPTQGEIDILEARGQDPTGFQTAYWYGRRDGANEAVHTEVPFRSSSDLTTCWHVYEVTWRRDALAFAFDGREIEVKRGGYIPAMFGRRQRLALNVAVGGHFFADLDPGRIEPGAMEVDWVRVFVRR